MGLIISNKVKTQPAKGSIPLVLILLLFFISGQSQEYVEVVDLSGDWKFSIGDDPSWSDPEYNDTRWEKLYVPKKWEDQGFHGYDGYAWYRTTTYVPVSSSYGTYYLKLGYIDDVDEVFINGFRIGQTGDFPPNYTTAHNALRLYSIPQKYIAGGEKITIAVRVFDEGGEGGFIHGDVSVVVDVSSIIPDLDLQGDWRFRTGNCSGIPEELDFQNWDQIRVPGTWEDQGYKNYDGFACYATEFQLDNQFEGMRMVLLLGRIDDLDKVFLNGTLIGQSGAFTAQTARDRPDTHQQKRGYYIPMDLLVDNGKNVLVVKVLDTGGLGGIWKGSVGLITQDNYIQYWRNKRKSTR